MRFAKPNDKKLLKERALAYAAAALAAGLATLLRMALGPLFGAALPFSTYFVATLFVVWYFGFGAAVFNILLSVVAGVYFFLSDAATSPFYTASGPAGRVTVTGYVTASLAVSFLLDLQRRTLERVNREADRRKAAEDAEREQRQGFETTLASIGDAVISTDSEGFIVFANRVALALLRATQADILGKRLNDVVQIANEFTRAKVESPVNRVLREGPEALAEATVLISKDGTETPIDQSAAPIRAEGRAIQGAVLVFRDITERRRVELALLEAEQRYHATFDNAAVGIAHVGLDGRWLRFNDAVCAITGYSREELKSKTFADITHPDDLDADWALARRVASGEIPTYSIEKRYFRKDGSIVWVTLTVSLLRDTAGAPQCYISVIEDITGRKLAETALRKAAEELRSSNEALERSNEDLERFAFMASHDLQEPLRMITTYSQLLIKTYPGQFDSEAKMFVSNIREATGRMRDLLADLLAYAEIGSHPEMPPEGVDLNLIIDYVRQNLKASIEETGAMITSDPLPILRANVRLFTSLLQNLVANAIKYRSERPPRIHISVQETDGELQFAVADNGIGIEPEYHERIFELFKRLHGKAIPGTGVGLAICKRVVESYGGRIWVESRVGDGAIFFFSLPSLTDRAPRAKP
jgi:PAS domain S-box-containing protein